MTYWVPWLAGNATPLLMQGPVLGLAAGTAIFRPFAAPTLSVPAACEVLIAVVAVSGHCAAPNMLIITLAYNVQANVIISIARTCISNANVFISSACIY